MKFSTALWSAASLSFLLSASCTHSPVEADRDPASSRNERVPPTLPPNQDEIARLCTADQDKAPKEIFLKYKAMSLSYNTNYRLPNWVYHEIYKDSLERSCVKRTDHFRGDERLKDDFHIVPINSGDYKNTGYDRGHQAPSGDFQWSEVVNDETFFMTNMTPQTPNLNQRAWNSLEGRVRRWACGNGHIKVFTGPVIKANMPRLSSCVGVSDESYKVVLADMNGDYKAIGFIYSQNDNTDVWRERAMTVAEVEKRTGQTFFTEFPDDIAQKFKNNIDLDAWEKSESNCRACNGVPKPMEK